MNAAGPSDECLLERIAAGDEEAFCAFYERVAPRALGLLVRLVGDRAEAEDVLQDVMWEVWRRARSYRRELSAPVSWVLMIARARGVDLIRRSARRPSSGAFAGNDVAEGAASGLGLDDGVHALLGDLPAEQRETVLLAYGHGLTREQIASVTGVPIGTVKTRLRAALLRLRAAADAQGEVVA